LNKLKTKHLDLDSSSYHQQGELGTRKPDTKISGDRWLRERDRDNFNDINESKDSNDEDYDDYEKENPNGANMDWDSIGDFSQYPKAAGSDVSGRKIPLNFLTLFCFN
jgi:hypothetical protein